jgi:tRNA (cmo5U34)-methyltransferase
MSDGESSLGHVPEGESWDFDAGVTECFEDMLRRSIPQYDVMRQIVHDTACAFRTPETGIMDLGSSRGDGVTGLLEKYQKRNRFVLVEVSEPMLKVLRERFEEPVASGDMAILDRDLRKGAPHMVSCIIQSVLCIQFTPIEYRLKILQSVHDSLIHGGAFIMVEKVLGATGEIDSLLVDQYYQMKKDSGYTEEEIQRKRMSLEGVLVPLTAQWNEELMHNVGFRQVDCIWRCLNFAAWVAIK